MKNISWDINKKTDNIKFFNNNLTCEKEMGLYEGVIATINKTKGKWYWEISIDKCDESKYYSTDMLVGVCEESQLLSGFNDSRGFTNVRMIYDFGSKIEKSDYTKYGNNFKTGDVVSILLDLDKGSIEFWINGKSQGIAFDDLKGKTWFPCVFAYHGFKWTANFGASKFKYNVPNEYKTFYFLLEQNNQLYTIKSELYEPSKSQYKPITGIDINSITDENLKKYGFDDIGDILTETTIGNETFKPIDKLKTINDGKFNILVKELDD